MLKENSVCCLNSQMNLDLTGHGKVACPQPPCVRLLEQPGGPSSQCFFLPLTKGRREPGHMVRHFSFSSKTGIGPDGAWLPLLHKYL